MINNKSLKKLRLWDSIFILMVIIFGLFFMLILFLENIFSYTPIYYFLNYSLISIWFVFQIGMSYHAFRNKKYGWFILIILLGPIFPIWFYFSYLRKELKENRGIYKKENAQSPKKE